MLVVLFIFIIYLWKSVCIGIYILISLLYLCRNYSFIALQLIWLTNPIGLLKVIELERLLEH